MTIEIQLTRGHVAIVDDEDADLAELKWYSLSGGGKFAFYYAARQINKKPSLMHRTILERKLKYKLESVALVDHINGNTLDNRRENLRLVTHAENMQNRRMHRNNTSGVKGVSFDKSNGKWKAQVRANGIRKSLGNFDTPEAAYEAYCTAARELHGAFFNPGTKPETTE